MLLWKLYGFEKFFSMESLKIMEIMESMDVKKVRIYRIYRNYRFYSIYRNCRGLYKGKKKPKMGFKSKNKLRKLAIYVPSTYYYIRDGCKTSVQKPCISTLVNKCRHYSSLFLPCMGKMYSFYGKKYNKKGQKNTFWVKLMVYCLSRVFLKVYSYVMFENVKCRDKVYNRWC